MTTLDTVATVRKLQNEVELLAAHVTSVRTETAAAIDALRRLDLVAIRLQNTIGGLTNQLNQP